MPPLGAVAAQPNPASPALCLTGIGGGAIVSGLVLVGAPWWVIAGVGLVSILLAGVVLLAQVLVPADSEHKRDLWLAVLRDRRLRHREGTHRSGPRRRRRGRRSRRAQG